MSDDPAVERRRAAGPHWRSPVRVASRLSVLGLVLLALLAPLVTAVAGWSIVHAKAEATARSLAWSLRGAAPGSRPALSPMQARASAVGGARAPVAHLLAADGRVLDASDGSTAMPGWHAVADIDAGGAGGVARVRVGVPAAGVAIATAGVAFIAGTLALSLWFGWVRGLLARLQRAEGHMRHAAEVDALTGLLNRDGLLRRVQRRLDGAGDRRQQVGVLVLDLDRFGLVNDSLGQRAGDLLLREVARRLHRSGTGRMVVARVGGDRFALCAAPLPGAQAATVLARNLMRAVDAPFDIDGRETRISASVGIALAGADDRGDVLMARAEAAVRAAKTGAGERFRVFEPGMLAHTHERLELEMALRQALHNGEFALAFQPIIGADGLSLHAVEVLLRWNTAGRGSVPPAEFIPLLEQSGLIVPVGAWVLGEACRTMAGLLPRLDPGVTVSVNVSPLQFAHPQFLGDVRAALQATGLPAERLQIEVTEGLLVDPAPDVLRTMDLLVDAGIQLAVDDFGMGYSSLAYLKRFRLHTLKIDRMFVREVPQRPKDAAIVRAIVELGRALGVHVTAEGVETVEQQQALVGLGCDSLQGYLFARPMAAADLLTWLRDAGIEPGATADRRDWSTTMAAALDA